MYKISTQHFLTLNILVFFWSKNSAGRQNCFSEVIHALMFISGWWFYVYCSLKFKAYNKKVYIQIRNSQLDRDTNLYVVMSILHPTCKAYYCYCVKQLKLATYFIDSIKMNYFFSCHFWFVVNGAFFVNPTQNGFLYLLVFLGSYNWSLVGKSQSIRITPSPPNLVWLHW